MSAEKKRRGGGRNDSLKASEREKVLLPCLSFQQPPLSSLFLFFVWSIYSYGAREAPLLASIPMALKTAYGKKGLRGKEGFFVPEYVSCEWFSPRLQFSFISPP